MAIFQNIGEKRDCKQRAKALFPFDPDLQKAAVRLCKSSNNPQNLTTRQDFINLIGDEQIIIYRGYDPNPNNNITIESILNQFNTNEEQTKQLTAGAVIAALIVLFLIIRKTIK